MVNFLVGLFLGGAMGLIWATILNATKEDECADEDWEEEE